MCKEYAAFMTHPPDTAYYTKLSDAAESAIRVGWRDCLAQQRRFAALAHILPVDRLAQFSINDFGCGLGDFASYLIDEKREYFQYSGLDHSIQMIKDAAAIHVWDARVNFAQGSATDMQRADFTVASGVFNLRQSNSDPEWLAFIFETLERIDRVSDVGFAFNALTSYSDAPLMRPELYYADPLTMFDHCKRHFSRNVALLHDYDEYDFTIIVRKTG
jgi:SAM-dependent methyltransferase